MANIAVEIETPTFWNKAHPLTQTANGLFDLLVPGSGMCPTLQGELLRASSKISYDWFNNGWGCNNWSGAVVFLKEQFSKLPNTPSTDILKLCGKENQSIAETLKQFNAALDYVHEYSHGEPASHLDYNKRPCKEVTLIHETVVMWVVANQDPISNSKDMWDCSEEEYRGSHEDDDEEEY